MIFTGSGGKNEPKNSSVDFGGAGRDGAGAPCNRDVYVEVITCE